LSSPNNLKNNIGNPLNNIVSTIILEVENSYYNKLGSLLKIHAINRFYTVQNQKADGIAIIPFIIHFYIVIYYIFFPVIYLFPSNS